MNTSASNLSRRLAASALAALPFEPHPDQEFLLRGLADFIASPDARGVFVLNGYAGTGKTSLVGAMIKALDAERRRVAVLAPTGRAAKVASMMSAHPASTIHRRIFRPDFNDPGSRSYHVAPNESPDTLFIVDEASLIPDRPGDRSSLLELLTRYVYSAPECRMILVGDEAQLPPVGQEQSSAMNPDRLRSLGLNPVCATLDLPLRQEADSGIIHNATLVRQFLYHPPYDISDVYLEVSGFPGISVVSSLELGDLLADSYASVGKEETIVITRSNRRANNFNQEIRNRVLYAEQPVERDERLVISKNDYYWLRNDRKMKLIANGDMARVSHVGRTEKAYGRWFTEVELELADGRLTTAQLMLRSLVTDGPAIPGDEMDRFYNRVLAEYEGELSEKIQGALSDPYYNALQAKYAYCVTCHKAQGGQWKHVYVDMGNIAPDMFDASFFRWLYTAITRATEHVFLINPSFPFR